VNFVGNPQEFYWRRDDYRCRKCGRHRDELDQGERLLLARQTHQARLVLDPDREVEVEEIQTVCSRCAEDLTEATIFGT